MHLCNQCPHSTLHAQSRDRASRPRIRVFDGKVYHEKVPGYLSFPLLPVFPVECETHKKEKEKHRLSGNGRGARAATTRSQARVPASSSVGPPALEVRLRLRLDFISLLPLRVILSPGAVVESARTGIVKLGSLGSGQT